MVRKMHQTSHVIPYDLANCADLGDCPVNPANVDQAVASIDEEIAAISGTTAGAVKQEHLRTKKYLRALASGAPDEEGQEPQ